MDNTLQGQQSSFVNSWQGEFYPLLLVRIFFCLGGKTGRVDVEVKSKCFDSFRLSSQLRSFVVKMFPPGSR